MIFLKRYKYILIIAAVVLLGFGFYFAKNYWDLRKENQVLAKLSQTEANRQFVDLIRKDRSDLSKSKGKDQGPIYADMGTNFYGMHAYDYAVKYYSLSLSANPENDVGFLNLGNSYRQLRNLPKAKTAYLKSFEVSQYQNSAGCIELGDMIQFDKLAPVTDAEKIYLDCLAKAPKDRNIIAHLALYYKNQGDKKNALKYFDELSHIEPWNTEVLSIMKELSTP